MFDIDIDFPSDFDPLDIFDQGIRASMVKKEVLVKHPVGVYFQNIPVDHQTSLSAIPYKQAEDLGYFKIDFLHLNILDHFENKEQIRTLIRKEPDWELLKDTEVVGRLFHLHRHFKIIEQVKPQSIIELADCIALKLPSKRLLLWAYIKDRTAVRPELYSKPDDGSMWFKKGHAISYSMIIILQLHLIKGGII